ncbi:copper resistance CopC family protein [Castellaniella sp.]|uniref:copper resistance CopC family protein n=1 Tax=Castellaniella sp. TaxID=1955812 RepID=UPI003C73DD7F
MKSFLAACLLLWSQISWGNVALVATSLSSGRMLTQPPAEISLVFSEPVRVTQVDLVDPQGQALPLYAIRDAGAEVRIPIPPETAYGRYALNWHVQSATGDRVSGVLGYEVGEPSLLDRLWPASPVRLSDASLWLAMIVLLAATVSLILFQPQFVSATLGLTGVGLVVTGFQFERVAALWRYGDGWVPPALCAGALAMLLVAALGRWLFRRAR